MRFQLLLVLFLCCLTSADSTIESLFQVKKGKGESGTCQSRMKVLEKWLVESKAMAAAAMKVFEHAEDKSNAYYKIAWRYLTTYFDLTPSSSSEDISLVKTSIEDVQNFLEGETASNGPLPRLYCGDSWLIRMSRQDAVHEEDSPDTYLGETPSGDMNPRTIEDTPRYRDDLWVLDKGVWVRNNNIPWWSPDILEYVFDEDYGGKTFCTWSSEDGGYSLGGTQTRTVPRTMTLCSSSFNNAGNTIQLGPRSPKGSNIMQVLPRSATFYHEIFHLELGSQNTPDFTYSWEEQQEALKTPDEIKKGAYETNAKRIRRNPETYVWFSVGYWYFLQTQWTLANQRYSFHSGNAQLIKL